MRILHLTSNDAHTGGAVAAYRLHAALQNAGHESMIMVGADNAANEIEIAPPRSYLWKAADKIVNEVADLAGFRAVVRPSFALWRRAIESFRPDVVHIHWTYGRRSIPIAGLPSLTRHYPTVWTFHDMWAVTGGCTNSQECNRWLSGCGSCPMAANRTTSSTMEPVRWDYTALLWRLKRAVYGRSRFAVVCPSGWMADVAARSPLLAGKQVERIPNPLDVEAYRAVDKGLARQKLGVPIENCVLLFVGKPDSVFAYADRVPVFVAALHQLRAEYPTLAEKVTLLIVGGQGERLAAQVGLPAACVGPVLHMQSMIECFSASDLFINTTQFDNYPCVLQEALCCGLPPVVSRVGGITDLVRHMENGYLASRKAPGEFCQGIATLLANEHLRARLALRARSDGPEEFCADRVAEEMLQVYRKEIQAE